MSKPKRILIATIITAILITGFVSFLPPRDGKKTANIVSRRI